MQKLRREKAKREILQLLKEEIMEHLLDHLLGEGLFDELIDKVVSRRKDPYTGAREIVGTVLSKHG